MKSFTNFFQGMNSEMIKLLIKNEIPPQKSKQIFNVIYNYFVSCAVVIPVWMSFCLALGLGLK